MGKSIAVCVAAYGTFAYLVLALGAMQAITPLAIGVAFGVVLVSAIVLLRRLPKLHAGEPWTAALLALPFLHALFLPPFKEDDLMYHLWLPHQMVRTGGLVLDSYSLGAHFPLLFEFPLTVFEIPGVGLSPFVVNLVVAAFLAVVCVALGGDAPARGRSLLVSASLLWCLVCFDLSHSAYVELFFALEWTLILLLCRKGSWRWAYVIAGFAVGTKYYGLIGLGALFTVDFLRSGRERRTVVTDLVIAAAIGAPFYVKNWLVTGNPVFPFAAAAFESSFASAERLGLGHALAAGNAVANTGALPLTVILSFVALRRREPFALVAILAGAVFCIAWFLSTPNPRYIFPFLLPLAVIGAETALAQGPRARAAALTLAVLALAFSAKQIYETGLKEGQWALLSGSMTREEFLMRRYRGSYKLALASNTAADPARSKIMLIGMFGRAYYFDAATLSSVYFDTEPLLPAFAPGDIKPAAFWAFAQREGLTHVAVNWAFVESFHSTDGRFDVAAAREFFSSNGKVVYDDPPYQLIELLPP